MTDNNAPPSCGADAPWAARNARVVVLCWVLVSMVCAVAAGGIFDRLVGGGFTPADAPSATANAEVQRLFHDRSPDAVLLFRRVGAAPHTGVPDLAPAVQRTVTDARFTSLASVPAEAGGAVASGDSGPVIAVPVFLRGDTTAAKRASLAELRRTIRPPTGSEVLFGGSAAFAEETATRTQHDLVHAELLAAPVLLLLLLLVFRSLWAASLPLVCGAVAAIGALAALRLASEFTDVSVFAVNLVSMLGLGLAVDYGLLIITRYRQERTELPDAAALATAVRTAGRTVATSAFLVAAGLAGLALFPLTFTRSLAMGGIAVVAVDAAVALTLLPALLAVLGHRIDAAAQSRPAGCRPHARQRRARPRGRWKGGRDGLVWLRIAHAVTRRSAMWLAASGAVLLALAVPALQLRVAGISETTLPASSQTRQVTRYLEESLPASGDATIEAVVDLGQDTDSPAGRRELAAWIARAAAPPVSVLRPKVAATRGDAALVTVLSAGGPADYRATVRRLRVLAPPAGGGVLVGGPAAADLDQVDALRSRLPLVVAFVATVTFVVLLVAFRSLLVPLKAVATSALSTAAGLGVMVLVFQDGHLSHVLDFAPLGYVETTQPAVVLMVLFALSLDYEVFLLASVREEYRRTGDNTEAVATGLRRTGPVITGAAALFLVVIAAFATSRVIALKEVGVGLFAGILLDATLVRVVLVPAAMTLVGRANWWPTGRPGRPDPTTPASDTDRVGVPR
uniref:MMPL family transporter n=1 Tax=Streptomyces sp. NBC_00008 TaxID=2903610 RepID=A0AAU2VN77_9ACTN